MRKIHLTQDALPTPLFERLVHAVKMTGTERTENMGSYDTTFWFGLGAQPANIAEECISQLHILVRPGPQCIGMEWWLGRLKYGESLPFHTDRDRSLKKQTGEIVHPLWSSILYLNRFPSSPTIVLDQVWSPDGNSWIPPKPKHGRYLEPIPNDYVVFRGDLRHGVVANEASAKAAAPVDGTGPTPEYSELRLTLLINYWHRRPMPPNCRDYDGTIYSAILNERVDMQGDRTNKARTRARSS
jgi:hypothetical protein